MSVKTSSLPQANPVQQLKRPSGVFALVILTVVTLACLLPFLGKAFHIDDPLFIWCGRHIVSDPWNFYDFKVNWFGKEEAMSTAMQNPPLASYYLALIGSMFGWSEIALHAGFLLPALAVVWGTHRLAKSFCVHPLASGLVTIATPVFLVSGTSVMCDTMMLAFWVWALIFWMEGLANKSPMKLGASALLIAACGLTKYFGFALVPLVVAYSLAKQRKFGFWLAYVFIPVIVLVSYELWTRKLYGEGALFSGFSHAKDQLSVGTPFLTKIFTVLSFSGGSIIVVLFATPLLVGRRAMVVGVIAIVLVAIGVVLLKRVGHVQTLVAGRVNWEFVIQFMLFVAAGMVLVFLATADLFQDRTAESLLLFLWVAGTFAFVLFACWQVSGRYLLPMLPASSILMIRRLEFRKALLERNQVGPLWAPVGISLVIALAVTSADFELANSTRAAVAHLEKEVAASPTVWFEGHWGFQYYMEQNGAKAVDIRHSHYAANDALILPSGNSYVFAPSPGKLAPWFDYDCETSKYLATMCASCGAGFYSDDWGPLPFALCRVPAQQYAVFRAR
jgi:hypothetical protein